KRSANLQKYKLFQDREYTISNFTQGEGRDEGCIIFVCNTDSGHTFSVRPRGTLQQRREWFKNGKNLINKPLTVRYQELFPDSDVPRFPVGICVRDFE
ncbi:MAG: hypothetical protein EBX91_04075, partial [Actinobacteria bacterium]|nr:hypothetical protein [Actinomycetota bacterium]